MRPATDPEDDDFAALRARRAGLGLAAVLTEVDVVVVFFAALVVDDLRAAGFFAGALATEVFAAGDLAVEVLTEGRFFAEAFLGADCRTDLPVD